MSPLSVLGPALLHLRGAVRTAAREAAGAARCRREVATHERADAAALRHWQAQRLAATLRHAAAQVPFYRGRPVPASDDPDEVFATLKRWPVIDKQRVRDAGEALLARDRRLRLPSYSSGTTGSPMKTWRTPASIAWEQALIERQLHWAGWQPGERRVWLRGDVVVPLAQQQPPFWRRNAGEGMLMCSSFHLSAQTAAAYVEAIEAYDPVLIQAYPSSIGFLARWLNHRGQRYAGRSLRGIVTSSERLTPAAREACEQAFGVRAFDWYGQSERVGAIGTCRLGHYHVIEDAGVIEFERRSSGEWGVIGTSLMNDAMPLIRYDTGDGIELPEHDSPCRCGLPFRRVGFIHGRETDAIVTSNGRHHVMPDFVFDGLPMLKEAQFVQRGQDLIEIRLVLAPQASLREVQVVRERALRRFGPGVEVRLTQVDAIARTANGKFPLVVNAWMRAAAEAALGA
jgi:phenylacetate-CoA ligase